MANDVILYEGELPAVATKAREILQKPTPTDKIYTRPGPHGMPLAYVPWAWTAEQLNLAFGSSWSLKYIAEPQRTTVSSTDEEVLVMIELITPIGVQQAFGSHRYKLNNPNASYGDALQSATSKALRRAAARWGVGLDLYPGVEEDIEEKEAMEWAKLVEKGKESE